MSRTDLLVTSFDSDELKASLIEFLKSTDEFGDFNYDGSAINTIVDLLTRNTHYIAYMANMVANESFLDSAQLRSSIVSHASKLSYVPRSRTATKLYATITITPSDVPDNDILILEAGKTFIGNVAGNVFNFTTNDVYELSLDNGVFTGEVELFQGQRLTNTFIYQGQKIVIPNKNVDTSTLKVSVYEDGKDNSYNRYTSIHDELGMNYYFLSLDKDDNYFIEFGENVLGKEPNDNSVVSVSYINTQDSIANGIQNLIPGSTIGGYSNILIDVTTPGFGGSEKESNESIRFLAPKVYQAQERALTDSDYGPLIKSKYPFVKSIITWGGEDNNPPMYGTVFMSIISDEGAFISRSVKQDIINSVKNYNVGSITPEIVDPKAYGIDLDIKIYRDPTLTSKTFNETSLQVRELINKYNEEEINNFNRYFNKSELYDRIMDVRGLTSSDINYKIFYDINVLRFNDPEYFVEFDNEIIPGSLYADGFVVDVNSINHKLFDDNGIVKISYESEGATIEIEIGSVDYSSGRIDFIANFIQEEDELRIIVEPKRNNFYVFNSSYAYIDKVSINPLSIRRE